MTLVEAIRSTLQRRRLAPRTGQAYLRWILAFIRAHQGRHPRQMGAQEIATFLDQLTAQRRAAATRAQALHALVFLYKHVLSLPLPPIPDDPRPRHPERRPSILSRSEVQTLLDALHPPFRLIAQVLYGSGLRLAECLALRVTDLDFDRQRIRVADGADTPPREAPLPASLRQHLREHLDEVTRCRPIARPLGAAALPDRDLPAASPLLWPLPPSAMVKAMREAVRATQLDTGVTCRTLRDCFAVHLLEAGTSLRTVQHLLGHRDLRTTRIYAQLAERAPLGVVSPLDR
jgi:integrase